MVNTADLKSAGETLIGSIPIVSIPTSMKAQVKSSHQNLNLKQYKHNASIDKKDGPPMRTYLSLFPNSDNFSLFDPKNFKI